MKYRNAAITGLSVFADEVTEFNVPVETGWIARRAYGATRGDIVRSLSAILRADVWYTIGAPMFNRYIFAAARAAGKPQVVHWAGSDIESFRHNERALALLRSPRVLHLAEVDFTAAELQDMGLQSRIAAIPPRHVPLAGVPGFPQTFTVLFYVPKTRADFYGCAEYQKLIESFTGKHVRFLIVGGGTLKAPPGADVVNLLWSEDLKDVYGASTVLVRFTRRDGLSIMVLEALAFGRFVLWPKNFPHVTSVTSYDQIAQELHSLYQSHTRGTLRPRTAAADFIKTHYSRQKCLRDITRAWDAALTRQPMQRS